MSSSQTTKISHLKKVAGKLGGVVGGTPPLLGVGGSHHHTPSQRETSSDLVEQMKRMGKQLTKTQRKEVRDYLSLLDKDLVLKEKTDLRPSQLLSRDDEIWRDSCLVKLAGVMGLSTTTMSLSFGPVSGLNSGIDKVQSFVKEAGLHKNASYERKAVYNLLADLLVNYCKGLAGKIDAPLGPKLIFNNADKIPALFDCAYPGYLQSGLAGMIVDRYLTKTTERK